MQFPERFLDLPDYAFPRLRALLDPHPAGGDVIHMSIGEPKHPMPPFVAEVMAASLDGFGIYPANDGTAAHLAAIQGWLGRRYGVEVGADRLMVLNGTREGLFNAALALSPETKNGKRPVFLMPNPFYQVYAAAALAVGAEPVYVPATAETGFLPDYAALPAEVLDRVTIAYLCSPANPQGAIASRDRLAEMIRLAEAHDFRLFVDECYSEIWREAPPPGALEVSAGLGADPERVFVFHSLSKRSNLPGLRSGFVAGGPEGIRHIRKLRAFSGAPVPAPLQAVATAAWNDEAHVQASLALYHRKFELAERIFGNVPGYRTPEGGFFLWLPVEDGEAAALKLWTETGVRVVPGAYFSREVGGENPGHGYIRVALVAPQDDTRRGLERIHDCLYRKD
ncbi:aminotransferase class I/II-fold pyridoxal phosphate-dependent enzyme [Falsirhodobacter sp. 20TX0035]|uniref:aminotransferase class I/II-fold pyridoxal phosphate-dependent enzyme n=1 Tax=Falsirhodobacter sp. 20TX0035 TaxID=3022019 RepID=UPI00232DB019|nr:aminotransferase class I/II-fold pyridoxal phosphate-dependent enzyme [Falsirhodobacter sp. 20TX0035]MDB6452546.1 aminotransferase class I/II-fold pyridoxal phosphate-dependent enzyme [Falsirhodobacter sp. 20TX0035]